MTESVEVRAGDYPIVLRNVYLAECRFSDSGEPGLPTVVLPEDMPVSIGFSYRRAARKQLAVALTVDASLEDSYELRVTYVGEFEMTEDVPGVDTEQAWRIFAAIMAPMILYPFAREAVLSLTNRARTEPILLPLFPFQDAMKPDELEIPTPPEGD